MRRVCGGVVGRLATRLATADCRAPPIKMDAWGAGVGGWVGRLVGRVIDGCVAALCCDDYGMIRYDVMIMM